jgi:hypothetical protein
MLVKKKKKKKQKEERKLVICCEETGLLLEQEKMQAQNAKLWRKVTGFKGRLTERRQVRRGGRPSIRARRMYEREREGKQSRDTG